jgi:dihydropyrimidinase
LDGTDDGFFWDLLGESARVGKPIIVCHTENIEIVNRTRQKVQAAGGSTLRDWAACKPAVTESEPAIRAMYFAERTGARVYFPHISSRLALDEVRKWRKRYDQVWIETCPHYLTHRIDSDIGSLGRANPPFRAQEDIDALWEGLADGAIHLVASDHVPRKRATKEKGIWQASQGFPGTATILPILLHHGYHKGRLSLQRIAQLVSSAPARIFGLPTKGDIRVGGDADLTLVDVGHEHVVDHAELGSNSDYSLYDGERLKGWPVRTVVRGVTVMQDHRITGPAGHGRYLART